MNWIGAFFLIFIGALLGILAAAICCAAKNSDIRADNESLSRENYFLKNKLIQLEELNQQKIFLKGAKHETN